ncbi:NAD(P)/FAD-dependent oxidoreductase [Chryseolinea lacunae]|uniref:NADH:ubiquinone reductase (non-electrogenic) n=1 Tax=Chryseolinea lacunae TaxID=2801331 RepID=A0ABS1KM79_9BACT|nr:NAD(P)/FAD-dependent oxidoreductase [Chryseolinea lacunae]MBL0740352.1 NAD(P)/FAD-dependent oxidoreductase [Chryseolinea lacunae]
MKEYSKHVVIVGGGFAGINLAQSLYNNPEFKVTVVDQNNYNFFPPLLYQVATGFLETSNISFPFRKLFQGKRNTFYRMGELQKIVPDQKKIVLSTGEVDYDYLVLATGTETNFFGMENVKKNAMPMKTINDAIEMRNYLLQVAEQATRSTDLIQRKRLGAIVIAGGGPTGVEISGMLAEMQKYIFAKDYPELRGAEIKIYLIDSSPTLLPPMSKKSQQYTYDTLVKSGVVVKLNTQVKDYVDNAVILGNGEKIETRILIWAAGVTSKVFEGIPKESYGRGRRLIVDEHNKVTGVDAIYAIGDTSIQTTDANFPEGHPQLAQVAIQQGKLLAKNLKAQLHQKPLKAFAYNDKGSMAIIRRNKAVADLPGSLFFRGFIAWAMWLFIHLLSLINYRNRLKTLYNWTAAYFTRDQSLRMIIRPSKRE